MKTNKGNFEEAFQWALDALWWIEMGIGVCIGLLLSLVLATRAHAETVNVNLYNVRGENGLSDAGLLRQFNSFALDYYHETGHHLHLNGRIKHMKDQAPDLMHSLANQNPVYSRYVNKFRGRAYRWRTINVVAIYPMKVNGIYWQMGARGDSCLLHGGFAYVMLMRKGNSGENRSKQNLIALKHEIGGLTGAPNSENHKSVMWEGAGMVGATRFDSEDKLFINVCVNG